MGDKIAYLLKTFPRNEWSGPAWFSYSGKGIPNSFTLEYFIPLDKGHGASTEWTGDDFGKTLIDVTTKYPSLEKAVVGNIHSHHGMGAYFSGDDKELVKRCFTELCNRAVVKHPKEKVNR